MDKQRLPHATTSLVLGILSILTCICYGIIGLPLGIVAYVLGRKALHNYSENPEAYRLNRNAAAGKILGGIGIVVNLIYILLVIWVIYQLGWDAMQDPEVLKERIEEMRLLHR